MHLLNSPFISALSGPPVIITSEEYKADNIAVIVEWTQIGGVSYNVSVIPMVLVTVMRSTSVRLILSYNIEYNVSLEAFGICQNVAASIQLFYGELISIATTGNSWTCCGQDMHIIHL